MKSVAVIGAGLIGWSTALALAGEGLAVTVVAPADEAHMASTGNAATIADYAIDPVGTPDVLLDAPRLLFDPKSPLAIHRASALSLVPWLARFAWHALPGPSRNSRRALVPLLAGTSDDWRDLAASIGGDDLLRPRGAVYAYDTPQAMAAARTGLERRRLHGVAIETLGADDLMALEPGLPRGRFAGGALFAGALSLADPGAMLDLIARAATVRGVARIEARVEGLARTRQGWRLALDRGDAHEAATIVVAAGAWSRSFARLLGLKVPLDTERGYHVEFDMPDDAQPLTRPLCPITHGFYFTPLKGRLRAAGTVELGGRDAPPSPHRWEKLEEGARSVFPDLPPVARRWMGLRPSMPDSLPVIGAAGEGAFVAFGHGHIGLTLAPRTASIIADLIAGRSPAFDLHPFRPDRFL